MFPHSFLPSMTAEKLRNAVDKMKRSIHVCIVNVSSSPQLLFEQCYVSSSPQLLFEQPERACLLKLTIILGQNKPILFSQGFNMFGFQMESRVSWRWRNAFLLV